MEIVDIAFHAADNDEDNLVAIDEANVLANALRHAGRQAIIRYKNTIRHMAALPPEEPSPLLDNYLGLSPFDQIAADAERDAKESESLKKK